MKAPRLRTWWTDIMIFKNIGFCMSVVHRNVFFFSSFLSKRIKILVIVLMVGPLSFLSKALRPHDISTSLFVVLCRSSIEKIN